MMIKLKRIHFYILFEFRKKLERQDKPLWQIRRRSGTGSFISTWISQSHIVCPPPPSFLYKGRGSPLHRAPSENKFILMVETWIISFLLQSDTTKLFLIASNNCYLFSAVFKSLNFISLFLNKPQISRFCQDISNLPLSLVNSWKKLSLCHKL